MSNEQKFEQFSRNQYGVGKTYRSVDEAFRTADYANPIDRGEPAIFSEHHPYMWAIVCVLGLVVGMTIVNAIFT